MSNEPTEPVVKKPESRSARIARFDKYWYDIHASGEKASSAFDKAVATLSAGAIGVSMVFMKDIVGSTSPVYIEFLIASWAFLVISLLSILLSFHYSMRAHRRLIERATPDNFDKEADLTEGYDSIVMGCNVFGLGACILGISLMLSFAALNLIHRGNLPKKEQNSAQEIK